VVRWGGGDERCLGMDINTKLSAVVGADFGTDAVQTHMTNSRLTDPEVLEWRFPVLLESYSLTAGNGHHHGGNVSSVAYVSWNR